jgi:hypothetical protein
MSHSNTALDTERSSPRGRTNGFADTAKHIMKSQSELNALVMIAAKEWDTPRYRLPVRNEG